MRPCAICDKYGRVALYCPKAIREGYIRPRHVEPPVPDVRQTAPLEVIVARQIEALTAQFCDDFESGVIET